MSKVISRAVDTNRLRLHGKDHDVSDMVMNAKRELVERLYAETRRKLGLGVELDRVLFVGGGSAALAADIADWFPNQTDRRSCSIRQCAGHAQVPTVCL